MNLKLPWIAAASLAASPAMALQPLEVFIAAAHERNPDGSKQTTTATNTGCF